MKKFMFIFTYWLLQLTWGILMNLIGIVATLFCLIFLKGKMHRNGCAFITEVGGNWGGVSLGVFALCGSYAKQTSDYYNLKWYDETRKHEFGHSLQNMLLGPLFPFLVAMPSAIRYWLDYYGKLKKDYYDIWFESSASKYGTIFIEFLEGKKND